MSTARPRSVAPDGPGWASLPAWRSTFQRGLCRLRAELGAGRVRCIGVYGGARAADFDGIRVLPWIEFLKELWAGAIIA